MKESQRAQPYDAAIVGAGPAGAFLGYLLAGSGARVVIIEKMQFPRYKACGGGLTRRALDLLPFDISPLLEDLSHTTTMLYRNSMMFSRTNERPAIGMVMRDRFDAFLVEKAVAAGACFQDDNRFRSLSGAAGDLTVQTSRGKVNTRLVIGADGVHSRVARALGLTIQKRFMTALEGEAYYPDGNVLETFRGDVHFDFGVIPRGYGWVFPKKDHLSVGVVTLSIKAAGVRRHFYEYLRMKGLDGYRQIRPLKGHLIPFRPGRKNHLAQSCGLVVGDATACVDPLTGEGLYYALRGAQLAAGILEKTLQAGARGHQITAYTTVVRKELMADLHYAGYLSYPLYHFPRISRRLMERAGDLLGRTQLSVTAGEKTYREVYRGMLKKMLHPEFVWSLLKSTPGRHQARN